MKLILVCLVALSAVAIGLPSRRPAIPRFQGKRKSPLVGMYGTRLAKIEDYPYTVSLFSHYYNATVGSGAVLNDNWILTSAVATHGQPAEDMTIRGGSDNGLSGGQSYEIANYIAIYTDFFGINIALLKTKNKMVFSEKLKPIKLAKKLPKEGSVATFSGFGQNEIHSGMLATAQLGISKRSECLALYGSYTVFCTYTTNVMPDYDDYGSPLVQNNELVGIFNDNYQGELLTFTSIPKFYKWIAESIKRNSVGDEADGIVDNDEVIAGSIGNEAEEGEANDNGQEEGDKSDSGNEE